MKQCSRCGGTFPESEFYTSTMTSNGKRGECRTCTKRYGGELKDRARSDPQYRRSVRVIPNKRGNDSCLVAVPPAIHHALGGPHTILWTVRDGGVDIEAVECEMNQCNARGEWPPAPHSTGGTASRAARAGSAPRPAAAGGGDRPGRHHTRKGRTHSTGQKEWKNSG